MLCRAVPPKYIDILLIAPSLCSVGRDIEFLIWVIASLMMCISLLDCVPIEYKELQQTGRMIVSYISNYSTRMGDQYWFEVINL